MYAKALAVLVLAALGLQAPCSLRAQDPPPVQVIKVVVEIRIVLVPPGPGPGPSPTPPDPAPKPPEPAPVPDAPAPIPAEGLHVLIQYESKDRLTPAQHSIVYGKEIRDLLNSRCPLGPNGKTRQWRIWDPDVPGYDDSKLWGDAQKRAAGKGAWIIISNGKTGYEGPLPATVEKTMELIDKYSPPRKKAGIEEWSDKDN